MKIDKFHVYLADLNPQIGTEAGKIRPVVVVQTDLLNNVHPSTIVCPMTTKIIPRASILRVHVPQKEAKLDKASDILIDQIRAIDNRRFIKQLGKLSIHCQEKVLENLRIIVEE